MYIYVKVQKVGRTFILVFAFREDTDQWKRKKNDQVERKDLKERFEGEI